MMNQLTRFYSIEVDSVHYRDRGSGFPRGHVVRVTSSDRFPEKRTGLNIRTVSDPKEIKLVYVQQHIMACCDWLVYRPRWWRYIVPRRCVNTIEVNTAAAVNDTACRTLKHGTTIVDAFMEDNVLDTFKRSTQTSKLLLLLLTLFVDFSQYNIYSNNNIQIACMKSVIKLYRVI